MIKLTGKELRQKYLDFFKSKGHTIMPSASLIPENDPTVLFTTAGMHPLVPFLMGAKHPLGTRLANAQKCIRTQDIDEVGDNRHSTFFEMMGNWSLGDYFKKEAIAWSFEFLTEELKIDPHKLYVTVFEGDKDAPIDEESIAAWKESFKKAGIIAELGDKNKGVHGNARIFTYPKSKNWWGPAGETGPCGPDTEMFIDLGTMHDEKFGTVCHPNCDCGRFIEIWNDVFMEFNKIAPGQFVPLSQKNVDTGMGLERVTMVLQGKKDIFATELYSPIMQKVKELSQEYDESSARIIADHMRTATFILGDHKAVKPSNVDQGYILRRLIRKTIRHGRLLGIQGFFTAKIAEVIINEFSYQYHELKENKQFIIEQLNLEEEKFSKTIGQGLKEFAKLAASKAETKEEISGKEAFLLFQSYGFPLEMTEELAREKNIQVDAAGFRKEFEKHQATSRVGAEKKFKGGLADSADETKKLHTATHILGEALRKVLNNPSIKQKGSNITSERLRYDFNFERKLTPEEVKAVEDEVNKVISKHMDVKREEMEAEKAIASGAIAEFGAKYPPKVSVYSVGDYSKEICMGPHVENTKELGHFKIQKEEASAAGVRRIKAVLEK